MRIAFKLSRAKYGYTIDAIVILPDHLHMIITPKVATDYPKIVAHIKRTFIYGLPQELKYNGKLEISNAKYNRRHGGIWQERFYEHTIRDEKDWQKSMEYIKYNPIKHNLVEDLNDWQYSSFYKKS
ncbi:MAG: transposase [Epsilonproteobacteria bacterium]|nr:transposase [Campylobacterota bacterium]